MYKDIFAKRLKIARIKSGFTQKEVASAINIGHATLSTYESGRNEPSLDVIGTLAEYYNVSVDWLFGLGAQDRKTDNSATITQINTLVKQFTKKLNEIS